jgi:hypothetical protein
MDCRTTGRFLERTEYLQRKVTIPLDVPRTVKEVTPIRFQRHKTILLVTLTVGQRKARAFVPRKSFFLASHYLLVSSKWRRPYVHNSNPIGA